MSVDNGLRLWRKLFPPQGGIVPGQSEARKPLRPGERIVSAEIDLSPEAVAALPSLEELGVPPELLEAASEIADASDVPGLERYRLEVLVRVLLYHDRRWYLRHRIEGPQPKIDELVNAIGERFHCMGGGVRRSLSSNPIADAMAKGPLMFALGVDVREVVEFVLNRLYPGNTPTNPSK